MKKSVVVIGAGIAGTAAALAARDAGSQVTVIDGGSGASILATGAFDELPWDECPFDTVRTLSDSARFVLDSLGIYSFSNTRAVIATTGGILRPARGIDKGLLDIARIPSGTIIVARMDHFGWDAASLARAWSASQFALDRGIAFAPSSVAALRYAEERFMPDADMAERHDSADRIAWLAERLRDALKSDAEKGEMRVSVGVLLPPWLGISQPRSEELSRLVEVPCGEALGSPGGPSGLRFERAREKAFSNAGVDVLRGRAIRVKFHTGSWVVEFRRSIGGDVETLRADRVVLAIGGLIGGGLSFTPSASTKGGEFPIQPHPSFHASVDGPKGPLPIGVHGSEFTMSGSLFGQTAESIAWPFVRDPILERAGVLTAHDTRVLRMKDGLFAAGDIAADHPRTWVDSLTSGARAGRHASAE